MRWLSGFFMLFATAVAFRVGIHRRHRTVSLAALKPDIAHAVGLIRTELAAMEEVEPLPLKDGDVVDQERADKLRSLRTVVQCADALVTIDRDLETFQEQLEGNDAKLKQIAEIYQKEFLELKEQIETQLNTILET